MLDDDKDVNNEEMQDLTSSIPEGNTEDNETTENTEDKTVTVQLLALNRHFLGQYWLNDNFHFSCACLG